MSSTFPTELAPVAPPPTNNATALLPWPDVSFRAGLLLAAGLFLVDAVGTPIARGFFALAGLPLAFLAVLALATSWQVLGDWRDRRVLALLSALAAVLAVPFGAAITPQLGGTLLPDGLETTLTGVIAAIRGIPPGSIAFTIAGAVVSLGIILALSILLMRVARPGRWGALTALALLVAVPLVFFNPSPETLLGLLFLALFLGEQSGRVLILPPHLEGALGPRERALLLRIAHGERLPRAEADLLLGGPEERRRLAELRLVAADREDDGIIVPGPRLDELIGPGALPPLAKWLRSAAWFLFGVAYLLFPDLIPGPFDDVAVLVLTSGFGALQSYLASRRPPAGIVLSDTRRP